MAHVQTPIKKMIWRSLKTRLSPLFSIAGRKILNESAVLVLIGGSFFVSSVLIKSLTTTVFVQAPILLVVILFLVGMVSVSIALSYSLRRRGHGLPFIILVNLVAVASPLYLHVV